MPEGVLLTLTAMIYAIVANVVKPARTSLKNVAPRMDFGCALSANGDQASMEERTR